MPSESDNSNETEKHIISLVIPENLKSEEIVTRFEANKKSKCIVALLNHKYERKSIVSTIYPDWLKTLDRFTVQAHGKGISECHIGMITDAIDDNHEKIMECIINSSSGSDYVQSSALEFVKTKIQETFLDEVNAPFTAIKVDNHIETIPIDNTKFGDWVGATYYYHQKEMEDNVCPNILSKEEISKIQSILRFEAQGSRLEAQTNIKKLHLRVAAFVDGETEALDKNVVYYDLCNPKWEVVKITRHGWTIDSHKSPIFKRYTINNPQVYPSKAYPADIMDKFIQLTNVKNDQDNTLLAIVYIVSLFLLENLPKPLLAPNGVKGSAKSTLQEFIKLIVDPSAALTTVFPKNIEELIQALSHSYLVIFDNVSKISELTSDQLCRAVTGSGFTKRGLYSNDEDVVYNMKRAVGYNGINIAATRADLLDRMLPIHMSPIDKRQRKKIASLQKEFQTILPEILGYIFDIIVKVLNRLGEVKLEELPRMADFAELGELIARCLGYPDGKFTEAYNKNIGFTNAEAVGASAVATAINALMNTRATWSGKAHELLLKLNETISVRGELVGISKNNEWPKTPRALTERINEIIPNMSEIGTIIERIYDPHTKSHSIIIVNNCYSPSGEPARG